MVSISCNMPIEGFQSTRVYYQLYLGLAFLREAGFTEMKVEIHKGQMLIITF